MSAITEASSILRPIKITDAADLCIRSPLLSLALFANVSDSVSLETAKEKESKAKSENTIVHNILFRRARNEDFKAIELVTIVVYLIGVYAVYCK